MKKILLFSFTITLLVFFNCCQKQAATNTTATYIKSIGLAGSGYATVNSFPLSDGNYLVAGKAPTMYNRGLMVKFSLSGTLLWQKSLSYSIVTPGKAMALGSGGFVVAGFDETPSDNNLNIITFDNNGDSLASVTLKPGTGCSNYPLNMIQLNNGGFAFSGCVLDQNSFAIPFLLITDNGFNQLYYKLYSPVNDEHNYTVTGLSEASDGSLNLSGFIYSNNQDNAFLLSAYSFAVQKSFITSANSNLFETPTCMGVTGKGNIILPNATANILAGSGVLVNYEGTAPEFVSGTIGISTLDSSYSFAGLVQYSGYPVNGMISSVSSTQDGGFILSGTVNQSDSRYAELEIYAMKLDANLNEQWSNTYNTYYSSIGVSAFQASDGGYIIAGTQVSFGRSPAMVIIKTDANGNVN